MKNLFKIVLISQIVLTIIIAQNNKGANEFFETNNIEARPLSDTSYIDPFSFFPSQVGNFWQYSGSYIREEKITKDSILTDTSKYLYFGNDHVWPYYQIDINYNVIFAPFWETPETLYVLNAEKGERWWVKRFYEDSIFVVGHIAEVDTIYKGNYLGRDAVFKVINDYLVYNNNGVLEEYWDHDVVLASGIGLVYEDMEAEAPKVLISAIINGDTLGTIVGIKNELQNLAPNDFTLFQNYPNPFNSTTIVKYEIYKPGYYKMIITNILGEIIEESEHSYLLSGTYQKKIDFKNFSSGLYFYTFFNNLNHKTIKMIYLR